MDWESRLKTILRSPQSVSAPSGEPVSSVLILVGPNSDSGDLEILLTKRTQWVETHKNQISFPGGYSEKEDTDLLETALRETFEEIGVHRQDVLILGGLEPVRTRGSVLIYPWVGKFQFPYPFQVNAKEVDKILLLSVASLVRSGLKKKEIEMGGMRIESLGIDHDGEVIWGATARMLGQLLDYFKRFPIK